MSPGILRHSRSRGYRIGAAPGLAGRILRLRFAMNCDARPLVALLLLCIAARASAAPVPELPERFEATFLLEAAGATIARTRWSLAPGAGATYVSTSSTEPTGVFALFRDDTRVERSEWTYEGDWLQPLAYRYERSGRKAREIDIEFDWETGVARHDSPGSAWRLPVPRGTMDKFNYILALMRDLSRGKRQLEYTIADGGRLRRYVLTGVGEERIETALGTFDTTIIRRERENNTRLTTFWCADELGFLPVKIVHVERDGKSMTLEIESLSGIERRAP